MGKLAVGPPAPTRQDPRAEATVAALVHAAEQLFAERRVDEVTVEELAAHARVAVSSIYKHFGSKLALYAAVLERAVDTNRDFMDSAFKTGRAPAEQIRAAGQQYLRFYLEHPDFFRALAFPPDPGSYQAGRDVFDRLAQRADQQNIRLAETLECGIADGTIRPGDTRETATLLWAAWNGIISLGWRPDALRRDDESLAELVDAATEIVMHGLLL